MPILFRIVTPYKSIGSLPIDSLPDFSLITGPNGSGKSQFLEAVSGGAIFVEGIPKEKIRLYDWASLRPPDQARTNGAAHDEERRSAWQQFQVITTNVNTPLIPPARPYSANETAPTRKQMIDLWRNDPQRRGEFSAQIEAWSQAVRQSSSTNQMLRSVVERIEKSAGLPCVVLTEQEFFDNYPLAHRASSPFSVDVSRLCSSYVKMTERNDLVELRHKRGISQQEPLTPEEFISRWGPPPWETINRMFELAGLNFVLTTPDADAGRDYQPTLVDKLHHVNIQFSELSSGEKILASVALCLFALEDPRLPVEMPEIIMFDEIDGPLHPSMASGLLKIVNDTFVNRFKKRVLMTTHSPSTVALAPDDSIFVMNSDTRTITKQSKDRAVATLLCGVPALSIRLENRLQVFVESGNDAIYWDKIEQLTRSVRSNDRSLSFIPVGQSSGGGCAKVLELVSALRGSGTQTARGIIDWDLVNEASPGVVVAGEGRRYSIENYILDPVLVGGLLLRDKIVPRARLGLEESATFISLQYLSSERLQIVSDAVLEMLGWADRTPRLACGYVNGTVVHIPVAFLTQNGHELEALVRRVFPALNQYHKETMVKLAILSKLLDDAPGLMPADLLEVLVKLAE